MIDALASVPVSRCACGRLFRGAACPCCGGTGVIFADVPTFGMDKGGHNRTYYSGEKAPRGEGAHKSQIKKADALMAEGMGKTAACREVGIAPRVYDYWVAQRGLTPATGTI